MYLETKSLLVHYVYELFIHFEVTLESDFSQRVVSSCLRHAEEEEKSLGYVSGLCAGRRELSWLAAPWGQPHPGAPVGAREAGAHP